LNHPVLYPRRMADTPDLSELPPLPASPTQPASVNHESTMDITSASPDARINESEAPDALMPQETQVDGAAQEPPPPLPPPSSVQFIGINYVPPSANLRTNSQLLALDPTPWESSVLPSTEDQTATGKSSFPPKRPMKRSVPVSSYYYGPPPADSAYFTPPMGQIGVHHPREIVRVERDYSGGEIVQFASTFPMELEGRITPTQFLESINAINEVLISAYNLWRSVVDNCVEILSLQLSRLFLSTHYQREMSRLQRLVDELNRQLFNPVGLNMLWPRKVGFLFLEIEYY